MNLLESYDKYGNQLKESFIKKTSSRNTDEVIKQADESFDTDFLFEKTCFLLKAICKGKKDVLISFNMPYYHDDEGKLTNSYYLNFKDCSIWLCKINYNLQYLITCSSIAYTKTLMAEGIAVRMLSINSESILIVGNQKVVTLNIGNTQTQEMHRKISN